MITRKLEDKLGHQIWGLDIRDIKDKSEDSGISFEVSPKTVNAPPTISDKDIIMVSENSSENSSENNSKQPNTKQPKTRKRKHSFLTPIEPWQIKNIKIYSDTEIESSPGKKNNSVSFGIAKPNTCAINTQIRIVPRFVKRLMKIGVVKTSRRILKRRRMVFQVQCKRTLLD